jgi:hypothetical protein
MPSQFLLEAVERGADGAVMPAVEAGTGDMVGDGGWAVGDQKFDVFGTARW